MMSSFEKITWWLSREGASRARWLFCRCFGHALIRHGGSGTEFFGRVRFGSADGNIFIGRDCWIGHDVFVSSLEGARVELSDRVSLNTGGHVVAVKAFASVNTHGSASIVRFGTRIMLSLILCTLSLGKASTPQASQLDPMCGSVGEFS
jgi:hypothetical protein